MNLSPGFWDELRLRVTGDRREVKDRKGRVYTITRIIDPKIAKRWMSDYKRYPNGHRNLTKAQRRAWGLMGVPGRPWSGLPIFAPGTFEASE